MKIRGLAMLAWAVLMATEARGDPAIYTAADWLRKPKRDDLVAVWPGEALKVGKGGKATIQCTVNKVGILRDCEVISESPAGAGFGMAALALTPQFLMKPATRDGKPVESRARIPINFPSFKPPEDLILSQKVASNVPWLAAPTYAEVVQAYPEKARAAGLGGRATISCEITKDGSLSGCETLTEEPRGMGLGRAAKGLSQAFVSPPTFSDGSTTRGALTHIQIVFRPEMLKEGVAAIGSPDWRKAPSSESFSAAFPVLAAKENIRTGRVRMNCQVVADGRLDGCKIVSEDPPGKGFGDATLRLAPEFQFSVWSADGLPIVGGRVTVPIRYELQDPPKPAAPPPKP